jgi:hypothetical protein
MKKLFILGMFALGTASVFAFPFRTTCGIVFSIDDHYADTVSTPRLTNDLMYLNFNACGQFPSRIVYY